MRSGNGILMPPDEVSSGQHIRVVASPLELSSRSDRLRIRVRPGSRFRVERIYEHAPALRLAHRGDTGSSYTNGPPVHHRWGNAILIQQSGRLSWSSRGSDWSCTRGSDFSGYWLPTGNNPSDGEVADSALDADPRPGCGSEPMEGSIPLAHKPPEYQRHVGALMPPRKVLDKLARSANRGEPPETLRDALGYWAFDRWGEMYLYEPRDAGFRLTSAGPDGAFYSGDDRRWTRRVENRSEVAVDRSDSRRPGETGKRGRSDR